MTIHGESRWSPPDPERQPINIHPATRDRLRTFLFRDDMRGVGYTEFIERALDAAELEIDMRERFFESFRVNIDAQRLVGFGKMPTLGHFLRDEGVGDPGERQPDLYQRELDRLLLAGRVQFGFNIDRQRTIPRWRYELDQAEEKLQRCWDLPAFSRAWFRMLWASLRYQWRGDYLRHARPEETVTLIDKASRMRVLTGIV